MRTLFTASSASVSAVGDFDEISLLGDDVEIVFQPADNQVAVTVTRGGQYLTELVTGLEVTCFPAALEIAMPARSARRLDLDERTLVAVPVMPPKLVAALTGLVPIVRVRTDPPAVAVVPGTFAPPALLRVGTWDTHLSVTLGVRDLELTFFMPDDLEWELQIEGKPVTSADTSLVELLAPGLDVEPDRATQLADELSTLARATLTAAARRVESLFEPVLGEISAASAVLAQEWLDEE